MKIIPVRSAARVYSVECGRGALARLRRAIAVVGESSGVFIVSSPQVWKGCGRRIERALAGAGRGRGGKFAHVLFDDRESAKGLATVEGISRELSRAGADRGAVLLAVQANIIFQQRSTSLPRRWNCWWTRLTRGDMRRHWSGSFPLSIPPDRSSRRDRDRHSGRCRSDARNTEVPTNPAGHYRQYPRCVADPTAGRHEPSRPNS